MIQIALWAREHMDSCLDSFVLDNIYGIVYSAQP